MTQEMTNLAVAMIRAGNPPQAVISTLIEHGAEPRAAQIEVRRLMALKQEADLTAQDRQLAALATASEVTARGNRQAAMAVAEMVLGVIVVLVASGLVAITFAAASADHSLHLSTLDTLWMCKPWLGGLFVGLFMIGHGIRAFAKR